MHGFESTLRDLFLERERIARLADRIVEIDLGIIDNIGRRFPGQIHGFSFTDDWVGVDPASSAREALG